MASDEETAWLAGLLEGEGSFFSLRSSVGGKVYRYPVITVAMTDRDVITRVAELFGNGVYHMPSKNPNRLDQFRAQISGEGAVEWMKALRPWMGARRGAKIDELLKAWAERVPANVGRAVAAKASAANKPRSSGRFVAR